MARDASYDRAADLMWHHKIQAEQLLLEVPRGGPTALLSATAAAAHATLAVFYHGLIERG